MKAYLAALLACASLELAACSGPDCRRERHVPFEVVERKIDVEVLIATRELVSGTAMRRQPGYMVGSSIRDDECYWYIEVFPSPKAAVKRTGYYIFNAVTGDLVGASTAILHVDHFFSPSPAP
ncbi:MAG TPA: hypothetical protein VK760_00665 [Candidatus Acidoferrales bacterium]|jgi:hypothetical protein|nr:hypothetical protein [Candidatus Acidoferrales bacterium]